MSSSFPRSARKTREAARSAVVATNRQADVLAGLIEQHNKLARETGEALENLADASSDQDERIDQVFGRLNGHRDAFFARGLWGRLKFVLTGK